LSAVVRSIPVWFAKQIKTKYMLQHLDDSDDSEIDNDYPDSETEIETEE
jgi:hypothetical protein